MTSVTRSDDKDVVNAFALVTLNCTRSSAIDTAFSNLARTEFVLPNHRRSFGRTEAAFNWVTRPVDSVRTFAQFYLIFGYDEINTKIPLLTPYCVS